MTKEESIYEYLCKNCLGKDNRIKNYELRKIFNIKDDKSLRGVIKNIRCNTNMPEIVASKAGPKGGYWIANCKDDCKFAINHLRNRAADMVYTAEVIYNKMEEKYESN